MACEVDFKYVCSSKTKLDALQLKINAFKRDFVKNYVNYQTAVNRALTPNRSSIPSSVSNVNYNELLSIFTQLETIKNEVTGQIQTNSSSMKNFETTINANKRATSAASTEMTTLTNRADGSKQAYKDALGLYRRDVFKNIVVLIASGGIIYLTRDVFMETSG